MKILAPALLALAAPALGLRASCLKPRGLRRGAPRSLMPETFSAAESFFPFEAAPMPLAPAAAAVAAAVPSVALGFADQTDNIAGPLFASSLLPYLFFLAFLNSDKNGLPALAKFGYTFLLLFVIATIPSAIVAKTVYGVSLADADWLHGSAEALLTVTNLLVVFGLGAALRDEAAEADASSANGIAKGAALGYAALATAGFFVFSGGIGQGLGLPVLEAHSAFLGGIGDLPSSVVAGFGFPHEEPVNALSIPTWAIHFSSVIEYVVAMRMVWTLATVTGNPTWKGLTWGMLPLHASGVVACTYHLFYNNPEIKFMVPLQAGLTLLGDCTCAYAAYRIAASNGWTPKDLNPLGKGDGDDAAPMAPIGGAVALSEDDSFGYRPSAPAAQLAKLVGLTVAGSYLVKYGSLASDFTFSPTALAALAIVAAPPLILAGQALQSSPDLIAGAKESGSKFSMADIKKFGVAGSLAYFITELIFWVTAIPVAAVTLYNTQGHWPDWSDNQDRVTVLGFVFAASNVARAALPLRFGAALALAPWVDENIVNRNKGDDGET